MNLKLGTRGSRLALAQSGHMADALRARGHEVELVVVKTRGDQQRDISLQENLDKGFFTEELETALREGALDLVVHSLKDLPTASPASLVLGAIPVRAPVGDVLLARPDAVAEGAGWPLKPGATVGTSAARRTALLRAVGADVVPAFLRGNVPTRMRAAQEGRFDSVILARAGLVRLGLVPDGLVCFDLNPHRFLPAPGQGALAIQCRADADAVRAALAPLHDAATAEDVAWERGVLQAFEGGCHAAVGATVDRAAGLLLAGALVDGVWRVTAQPLGPDASARAADALKAGGSASPDLPWASPATPWW